MEKKIIYHLQHIYIMKQSLDEASTSPNKGMSRNAIEQGNTSEPERVRSDREERNALIETAIERYLADVDTENISIDNMPYVNEHGYIITRHQTRRVNYNIEDPDTLFAGTFDNDPFPRYIYINGDEIRISNPVTEEIRVDSGNFAFYWCPGDNAFGIRFKKQVNRSDEGEDNGEQRERRPREQNMNQF
ncbi:hypothetical protein H8356DRAFT_1740288 [Neocallimastix lanati (nom. inval.)]|nr:hypothetical protein H8356DRAFT_1740288 [Neocallimastix sp. JGI-2020a]